MSWFKKNKVTDWMLLHAMRGEWKVNSEYGTYSEYCNFEIYYSPSKDKVKLEKSGYKPNAHTMYETAMGILSQYNRAILENIPFNELKEQVDELLIEKHKE